MKKRETFQTIKKPLNITFIKTLKQLEIFPLSFNLMAERVGFEPTVPLGTIDFESITFDHSDTSPLIHDMIRTTKIISLSKSKYNT